MNEILTVFTPTYNRSHTLFRLYNSLCRQTNQNFKWVIVDDGSVDDTEELVKGWLRENRIKITYHKQENRGKAMAHNKGVELTDTELFACIDSDDWLVPEAVATVADVWGNARDTGFVGMLAYKGTLSGEVLTVCEEKIESSTLWGAYSRYGLFGDAMLIFKTEIVSKYSFPYYDGEKFVPESYLYDQINQDGELYFIHKVLCWVEYLEDGYTRNIRKVIKRNPKGYIAYISQRIRLEKSLVEKCKDTVRYIAVGKCGFRRNREVIKNAVHPVMTVILWPVGIFFYGKLYRNIGEG